MTYKAFWLSILMISIILLPNTLPTLSIGGFSFEWQLGDFLIMLTGIYLLIKVLLFNGKFYFILGITRLDKVIFILLFTTFISSTISSLRFSSSTIFIIGSLIKTMEVYIIYYFVRNNIYREKDVHYVFKTLVLITVVVSLIGLIQIISPELYLDIIRTFLSQSRILQDESFLKTIGWRVSSLFLNPNKLANFILIMLPFIFASLYLKESLTKKVFYWILINILFLLLIFTLSREGWLGFIFMFIYILYAIMRYDISPYIKRNIGIILILMILLVSFNYNLIYHRIIEYTFGNKGWEYLYEAPSSEARFILWNASLKAISQNWLLGAGPMGRSIVQEFVPWYFITGGDPHNTFLRVFLENGIIGFITFLLFIKELLNFGKVHLKYSFEAYKYSIVAGTTGLIFSGFLGDSFQDFEPMIVLLTMVALLENLRRGVEYEDSSS